MDLPSLTPLLLNFITTVLADVGIPGLFALMVVESLGIPPLPSEIILPLAGFLVWENRIGWGGLPFTWTTVMVAAVLGGWVGALLAYGLGRYMGLALIHRLGRRFAVSEEDLKRAERFFARRGPATVGISRLVPVLRAYISYPAGAAEMNPVVFSIFTILGSVPFAVALVYAGYVLRQNYLELSGYFHYLDILGVGILVLLGVWASWAWRRRTHPPERAQEDRSASTASSRDA
jgi:membrane protein DedA with SNARE-associated domain